MILSDNWKREPGQYTKDIGTKRYAIVVKGGYWSLSYLNLREVMGYYRHISCHNSFETATLQAEIHASDGGFKRRRK